MANLSLRICGNKMPTRCNRGFLLQILLLAQHVSFLNAALNDGERLTSRSDRVNHGTAPVSNEEAAGWVPQQVRTVGSNFLPLQVSHPRDHPARSPVTIPTLLLTTSSALEQQVHSWLYRSVTMINGIYQYRVGHRLLSWDIKLIHT